MKAKAGLLIAAFIMFFSVPAQALVPISTPATHAILMDVETGSILLDKKAHEQMPTSSMSKVMTLYVVFDALKQGQLKLTDKFTVSEKAWKMGGSRMFVEVGTQVKVEDLIRGVAIQSGNDATVVLAEGLAGSEQAFVDRMNIYAKELGMHDSHFMNASGWPEEGHYSSPYDLAMLSQRVIEDFPEYYRYFGEKEFTYNKIRQPNRDPLLGRVEGADGVKTGHTDVAGYGLIGTAIRNGRRLMLVVNGLESEKARAEESTRLLEWGFRNFENVALLKKGQVVEQAPLWLGREETLPLVSAEDLTVVLPTVRRGEKLNMTAHYQSPVKAPVKQGDEIGTLKIEIPDQPAREVKLLAGQDAERKGFFARAVARFMYLLGAG